MKRLSKPRPTLPARLFSEPEHPRAICVAHVDGASRGNPGPSSYAVILRSSDGQVVFQLGKYLGRTTNNVAEYYALITALDYAAAHGIRQLRVRSDSELLVRQMQGRYKVKSAVLRPLYERARKLANTLSYFHIEHVPREQNADADALADAALDQTSPSARRSSSAGASPSDRPQAKPLAASHSSVATRRLRARYSGGALHPSEPLDLEEGEEVELALSRKPRS